MIEQLLNCDELANSDVVANSIMNRTRNLVGGNSYEKELGFNPIDFLERRLQKQQTASWLDLCCGSGRALIQGAQLCESRGLAQRMKLIGVDLMPVFDPVPSSCKFLQLQASLITSFLPRQSFDLITCVHGLHYIGDKLGAIQRAAEWLCKTGLFIAQLDYNNLHLKNATARMSIGKDLARAGFTYQSRYHRLTHHGGRVMALPYKYLGAHDQAGPNYTGQPAVNSYYTKM
jgi:SAM-dependent methyltransferase